MKRTVAGLVLVLWAQAAFATFVDGNKLLNACRSQLDFLDGVCTGYIASAVDTHEFDMTIKREVCIPSEATLGQLKEVVVKFMKENPAKLHYSGTGLTLSALKQAFPCK